MKKCTVLSLTYRRKERVSDIKKVERWSLIAPTLWLKYGPNETLQLDSSCTQVVNTDCNKHVFSVKLQNLSVGRKKRNRLVLSLIVSAYWLCVCERVCGRQINPMMVPLVTAIMIDDLVLFACVCVCVQCQHQLKLRLNPRPQSPLPPSRLLKKVSKKPDTNTHTHIHTLILFL